MSVEGMSIQTLVVVGASLAGLRAVEAARKDGFEGNVVLVGAERHLPYDRPPLSKAFLGETQDAVPAEIPYFRSESVLRDELGVDLRLGQPASSIDLKRRSIVVGSGELDYDALVIATGAHPRPLPNVPDLAGVHSLRNVEDALAVRDAMDAGARIVVIGAGFIGSEVAASGRKRGLDVTIVEALPTPLVRATGTAMGMALARLHERNGTKLACGSGVRSIEGRGRVEKVVLDNGQTIPADLVVIGIGVTPTVDWLGGCGLAIDNGVVCDENLWTGVPGVYAAGDVANWINPTMGERQRMENWTAAAEQGAAAARNALNGDHPKPYGTVPYSWSDWYDERIQFVGSPQADEVQVVHGDPREDRRWIALYRRNERLIGALTVNGQTEIMKYRGLIGRSADWEEGLAFAASRAARTDVAGRG